MKFWPHNTLSGQRGQSQRDWNHSAQGCEERATPGKASQNESNPERVESTSLFGYSRAMPESLAKILVHTVFSTKDRRPFLRDKPLREELHRYLGGILM